MKEKNTTNYKFLKNFRPELYKLAVKMEEDLLVTPISMLAYGTRFLEYILYDIAKLNDYEVDKDIGFVKNIYELIQQDFIDFDFGDLLIKAYYFRNSSIHDTNITKSLKEDKKNAFELNRRLFDIADAYYKMIENNYEKHYYAEPEFSKKEKPEFTTIIKQEKIFDTCIICGKSNKISKSNFCQDCDNLLNYRDVLVDIISKKGKNAFFRKDDFNYPFKNHMIKDLLSKDIMEQVGNEYNFVNDNLDEYFKLVDEFMAIDKYLVDFDCGFVSDYKNSRFYISNDYPYQQVSRLIDNHHIWQVVKLLENGFSIEYVLNDVDIEKTILDNWYVDKKSEFIDGYKDELFIRYNELLIKDLFKSIQKDNLCEVEGANVDFWCEYFEGFSKNLSNRLEKQKLMAFVKLFNDNYTKQDALKEVNLTNEKFDKLIKIHKKLAEEYYGEIDKRKSQFLSDIEFLGLNESITHSKLDMETFNKDKADYMNGNENDFYQKITQILQKRYLDLRKEGIGTKEICEELEIDESEVKTWDDDKSFEIGYQNVRLDLFKRNINNEKSKNDILKNLEITENELEEYIFLGKSGNKLYFEYYDYFENIYYHDKFAIFLNAFKDKSNINLALNDVGLTDSELEEFMKSDENFKLLNELKIDLISDYLIKKGKINPKFLKKMGMTKKDYRKIEEFINQKVIEKQVDLLTEATINDELIYFASKEINCSLQDSFDWIYKGSCGDEFFEQLADEYWSQAIPYIKKGNSLLKKGDSISLLKHTIDPKELGQYDLKYWQKWGLMDKNNKILDVEDIKNIIKRNNN